ncbi:M50 family metallopeptidase [Candidatus Microgenomates bacterium]|nr:M50 family metallopeptidase [Candidatus Microgenomates bacterium]
MKTKTKFYFYLLLNFPGIATHELSHAIFCWLSGVKVTKVVFFQFKNPPGFVEHHQPRGVLQSFFISFGPFFFGSFVSLSMFWIVSYMLRSSFSSYLIPDTQYLILMFVSLYLGLSVSLNLFPSDEDAKVLLSNVNYHVLHRFNPFAVLLYPFVLLIRLFNFLRRVHFDWAYAIFLFLLTWYFINE